MGGLMRSWIACVAAARPLADLNAAPPRPAWALSPGSTQP